MNGETKDLTMFDGPCPVSGCSGTVVNGTCNVNSDHRICKFGDAICDYSEDPPMCTNQNCEMYA